MSATPVPATEPPAAALARPARSGRPLGVQLFITGFFAYELLYVLGAFSTRHFFLLGESHRAISLGLLIVLTFLMRPGVDGRRRAVPWYDWLLMGIGLTGCLYVAPTGMVVDLQMGVSAVGPGELALGVATLLVVLEGTRRVSGLVLPALLAAAVGYAVFADRFPGVLYGRAHPFPEVIGELYLSFGGLFGSVMGLWTNVLVVFLLFGGFLQASGAGPFFIRLALAVAGRLRGGPAKVAVLASGLFGTISGSAAADCATTGVVTVPMMKGAGYRPAFAGAVEAVASTGGPLLPPIMGMVGLMVAEFLDMPYLQVCIAAAIPALLYYGTLFVLVDLEARRASLQELPVSGVPSVGRTLREGWFFFIPIGVLIYVLAILRYPPGTSALYALGVLFVVSAVRRETRLTPRRILAACQTAGESAVVIGIVCGAVGILIAAAAITGATLRSAVLLVELAGGTLLPLLLLAGAVSLVLGTGIPAIASYTLLAVTVAPAIVELGVPAIAAHLFVLYWGLTHLITPPVGGTLYIAASLAGVDIWRQGAHALRLGISLFVVPFMFCYHPELLMIGPPAAIAWQIVLAAGAMLATAASFVGYLYRPLAAGERGLLAVSAILFVVQGPWALGAAVLLAGVALRPRRHAD